MSSATAVAAPAGSPDAGVPWHYGDPFREQRRLAAGEALVDLSHRGVVTVTGPDRLGWLDDLTTARLRDLAPGSSRLALILDPHGHVEHELHLVDDGETTWMTVEPDTATALTTYLRSMQFLLRVEVAERGDLAVVGTVGPDASPLADRALATWRAPAEWAGTGATESGSDRGGDAEKYVPHRPGTFAAVEVLIPRDVLGDALAGSEQLAGSWAWEALRVAAAVPRLGLETDHRSLPHEVGWIGPAVHLAKGCYRGQEAVARTHNMGHPPRRLVLLHLDGSADAATSVGHGDEVVDGEGRTVGWVGTAAAHYELGPIATAVVKRKTDPLALLVVDGVSASQEPVVV